MKWLSGKISQLRFPAAFRIKTPGGDTDAFLLEMALPGIREATRPPEPDAGIPDHVDVGLTKEIANQLYRIESNTSRLKDQHGDTRELRGIRRASNRLSSVFDWNVEIVDLTGQEYDIGRSDFEPLGNPEPQPGVTGKVIWTCEQPAVFIEGRLVQKAKGIVAVPMPVEPYHKQ